jgi:hypothetical protein
VRDASEDGGGERWGGVEGEEFFGMEGGGDECGEVCGVEVAVFGREDGVDEKHGGYKGVLEADLEGDGDGDSVVIGLVDVAVFSGCDDVGEIPNEVDILGEVNVDLIA